MKSLMARLSQIVEAENAERITAVNVWLGALSHMSRAHFAEHFEDAAKGTPAEGARLNVTVSEDTEDPNAQEIILEGVEIETAD